MLDHHHHWRDTPRGGLLIIVHDKTRPLTGVWGRSPQQEQGPGAYRRAPGQGAKSPEAESILAVGRPTDTANNAPLARCSIFSLKQVIASRVAFVGKVSEGDKIEWPQVFVIVTITITIKSRAHL